MHCAVCATYFREEMVGHLTTEVDESLQSLISSPDHELQLGLDTILLKRSYSTLSAIARLRLRQYSPAGLREWSSYMYVIIRSRPKGEVRKVVRGSAWRNASPASGIKAFSMLT